MLKSLTWAQFLQLAPSGDMSGTRTVLTVDGYYVEVYLNGSMCMVMHPDVFERMFL